MVEQLNRSMAPQAVFSIVNHTTASSPKPHILYTLDAVLDGKRVSVNRRYSEFLKLHETLQDDYVLPPKRLLSYTLRPTAWVDDELIAERKAGLGEYITRLLGNPKYRHNTHLLEFLSVSRGDLPLTFDIEDAVPSTLSRTTGATFASDAKLETAATAIYSAYYPDWSAGSHPPENINFSKFDILFFAFAMPNASSTLSWDNGGQDILRRLVNSARNSGQGTEVVLSVGGWGGSYYFSSAVSNATNRATFVNALVGAVNTYGLDGIDIDWEYPNSAGAGNPHSPSDAANLLTFLTSLRSALGSSRIISAAVAHMPWIGADGNSLTNVSAYAAQMTFVNIMNYDVWGASSTPGPNAPFGNLCGTSTQPHANARAAFTQWTTAGFPASKLLLGLPLYGYVSHSTKTGLTGSLLPSSEMLLLQENKARTEAIHPDTQFLNGAHSRDKRLGTNEVEINAANLTSWWGQQIPFSSIVSSGALVKKADGTYGEGGGFTMAWDDCSDTPFLFNVAQQSVVTYDDTWSLADKAAYAKSNGMAGCFTWSLDQDDGLTLTNAIRKSLGKP